MSNQNERYTAEEINVRLKFFVGIILALTLVGIVGVILYSLVFVTQPLASQSPNDAEFFKLITPIATFLTGILSGIMLGSNKAPEPEPKEEVVAPTKPPNESEDTIA